MSNKSGGFSGFNDSSAGAPVVPTASPFGGPVQPPPLPRVPTGQVPTVPAVQSNGRQLSADLAGKKPVITQDRSGFHIGVAGHPEFSLAADGGDESRLDGTCLFDPTAGDPGARLVIWCCRKVGDATWNASKVPALAYDVEKSQDGRQYEIRTTGGFVSVSTDLANRVEVDTIFFGKLVVLHGDDGEPKVPDFPVQAKWRPAVKAVRVEPTERGYRYSVELYGLRGTIERTYEGGDVLHAGEPKTSRNPGNHLRIMVWPKVSPETWKLFVFDIGAPYNTYQWAGLYSWSLLRGGDLGNASRSRKVEYCVAATADGSVGKALRDELNKDPASSFCGVTGYGRVASRDRPEYLEIKEANGNGGGIFELRLETRRIGSTSPGDWGLDIGTSNSCVAYNVTNPKGEGSIPHPIAFNQVGVENHDSQVYCLVGKAEAPRCNLHWMPGLEGPADVDLWDSALRTQVPSRVTVLKTDATGQLQRWDSLTKSELAALVPMVDVVIPPMSGRRSLGNDSVDGNTVDNLKWLKSTDQKKPILLAKYISSMLVMAAARHVNGPSVNVHYGVPLAFSHEESLQFTVAISAACKAASALTGVAFNLDAEIADESRSIASEFMKGYHGDRLPIWVICDVGGGSVDIAVATANIAATHRVPPEPLDTSFAVLAADSVKFGANLVMQKVIELGGREIAPRATEATVEQEVRERLAEIGLEQVIALCSTTSQERIKQVIWMYYYLLGEYVARVTAGCIRNKQRFIGLLAADRDQGGYGLGDFEAQELLTQVELLITGNGFRTFDVLRGGRSDERIVADFSEWVRARIMQLLTAPVPDLESESNWFKDVPAATATSHRGLKVADRRLMKEAQAYAILASGGAGSGTLDSHDLISAPNGLNEIQAGSRILGHAGSKRPWYSFVGSPEVIIPSRKKAQEPQFHMGRDEQHHFTVPNVARDPKKFGPTLPPDITQRAANLSWNMDLNKLFEDNAQAIRERIGGTGGDGKRTGSLLKAMYEVAISRHFGPKGWL
jgi:hypothetical protein